jgi:4-amino-4-deoxy-L-arabinose transferase-like glycosyltransferase
MPSRRGERLQRWLLPTIVLLYLVLATLYAAVTPAWQAPDEPAHYNYVRTLAEGYRFPVLKPGDYPATYLEEIKAAHFPPEMSIAPIRYEFHQPPLYYLLAAPIYRLFGGALLPLRLLSVGLGALLLLVIHRVVRIAVPHRPFLAPATTAFVAFLPMHLTTTSAVNNDTLAELLLATILLLIVHYLRPADRPAEMLGEPRLLFLLGITTGLGFLTKSYVYIALPLVLAAIAVRHLWVDREPWQPGQALRAVAGYLLPALALGLPWWLRNMAIYGNADFLGLERHDQVVVGQLRTAEFVAQHGLIRLLTDFVRTSFRSFWGQFGWMGVLLDQRLYQALAILSLLALVGFVLWVGRSWRRWPEIPRWQRAAGALFALSGSLTVVSYLWYNATGFVQHQGRYLFPALLPLGLAVALGWREALGRDRALLLGGAFMASAVLLRLVASLETWPFLLSMAAGLALMARRFLPRGWDPVVQACPYALLVPLDVASLFLFILPQLAV